MCWSWRSASGECRIHRPPSRVQLLRKLMNRRYHTRFQPEKIAGDVFIAAGSVVVGDVSLAPRASVWFNAVLRGDAEALIVGTGSNIQDGAICHADPDLPLIIGAGVSVGHNAIVHGARIADHTLVGMGAIIMNGAVIGSNCIVGAGALVTQNKTFPDNSLIMGSPARKLRAINADEAALIRRTARNYVEKAAAFLRSQAPN